MNGSNNFSLVRGAGDVDTRPKAETKTGEKKQEKKEREKKLSLSP